MINGTELFFVFVLIGVAVWFFYHSTSRKAVDVLQDLEDFSFNHPTINDDFDLDIEAELEKLEKEQKKKKDDDSWLVFFADIKKINRNSKMYPIIGALLAALLVSLFSEGNIASLIFISLGGMSVGYILHRIKYYSLRNKCIDEVEFFLPIVMERIVMAVQAGQDILAAINSILKIEKEKLSGEKQDPVTKLLNKAISLVENGWRFDAALSEIAMAIPCPALRHSFIHLAVAYEEGGELVRPLRELSDATQLYYQEMIEEDIAKMPVKATLPLLVTFIGLVMFFVTSPMLQIMNMLVSATPK